MDYIDEQFKSNSRCPICYFNIVFEDANEPLEKQKQNKIFFDQYLKIVQCSSCKVKMHEVCIGKGKKKNIKCHTCEYKDEKKECVICYKSWGMMKKIEIENQKMYAHLPCLFFSNNFYCESFS